MTWVKLSDDFWRHPKIRQLIDRPQGLAAIGLWSLAQSWVGAELTDGYIPARQPTRLLGVGAADLVAELVAAGLWEPVADGWKVHGYLDYNPSREKIMATREARKEAGSKGGRRNADDADQDGRRDDVGHFTPKQVLGEVNGRELGSTPSNQPGNSPTPSPVSRNQSPEAKQGASTLVTSGGSIGLVEPVRTGP